VSASTRPIMYHLQAASALGMCVCVCVCVVLVRVLSCLSSHCRHVGASVLADDAGFEKRGREADKVATPHSHSLIIRPGHSPSIGPRPPDILPPLRGSPAQPASADYR
jgi:hypothetical protein